MPASSLALEVRRRGEEGDALIHDRLAHPQVVVQPLLHARGVAELLGLHTGAERQRVSLLAMLWAFRGVGRRKCSRAGEGCGVGMQARDWRQTYVRPVERRTPARKAETGEGCGSAKRLQSWVGCLGAPYPVPRRRRSARLCPAVGGVVSVLGLCDGGSAGWVAYNHGGCADGDAGVGGREAFFGGFGSMCEAGGLSLCRWWCRVEWSWSCGWCLPRAAGM